jgi:hypothetical protein
VKLGWKLLFSFLIPAAAGFLLFRGQRVYDLYKELSTQPGESTFYEQTILGYYDLPFALAALGFALLSLVLPGMILARYYQRTKISLVAKAIHDTEHSS